MDYLKNVITAIRCLTCGTAKPHSEVLYFERCGHFLCNLCCTPRQICPQCCNKLDVALALSSNIRLQSAYSLTLEMAKLGNVPLSETQKINGEYRKKSLISIQDVPLIESENTDDESTEDSRNKLPPNKIEKTDDEISKQSFIPMLNVPLNGSQKTVDDTPKQSLISRQNVPKVTQKTDDETTKQSSVSTLRVPPNKIEKTDDKISKQSFISRRNVPLKGSQKTVDEIPRQNVLKGAQKTDEETTQHSLIFRRNSTRTNRSVLRLSNSNNNPGSPRNLRKNSKIILEKKEAKTSEKSEGENKSNIIETPTGKKEKFMRNSRGKSDDSHTVKRKRQKTELLQNSFSKKEDSFIATAPITSDQIEMLWSAFKETGEMVDYGPPNETLHKKLGRSRRSPRGILTQCVNAKGETQLHRAVHQKNFKKISDLLNSGANPNTADYAGWTPLHDAIAKAGDVALVGLLLENGACPLAQGLNNSSPLHLAVENKNYDVIKILLEYGADPSVLNIEGKTPRDLAASDATAKKLLSQIDTVSKKTPSRQVHTPNMLIYCHDLTSSYRDEFLKFAKYFNLRHTNDGQQATHVVLPSRDSGTLFDWSLALIMAKGAYVCPITWCEDSIKAGRLVDERSYHIDLPWMPGWARARENLDRCGPGLFSGCHIMLNTGTVKSHKIRQGVVDTVKLREFIVSSGGQLLNRMPDPESPYNPQTVPYHGIGNMSKCSQVVVYVPREKDRSIKYNMSHLKCLPLQWIVDCILKFQIIPYEHELC